MRRREFAAFLGTAAVAATAPTVALARPGNQGAVADFDPLPFVHPELRSMVAPILKVMGGFNVSRATLEATRARDMQFSPPPQASPSYVEQKIPGPAGNRDLRVIIINGDAVAHDRPAILHIHGGGYIAGSAKSAVGRLQPLARELDCVIVTVEYRLAPETVFPGPMEDCYAALKWLYFNARALGIAPNRIGVMGDSAGGGLAAMIAISARDRGEVPLAFQCLVYPMLDDRTGSTVQKPPQQGAIIWSPQSNQFGWSSLLGVPAGSKVVPKGSVPAREKDLSGLPPTFISVGSIDLFLDEDVEYARRLSSAGVMTELVVMPGCFHGFDQLGGASVVQRYSEHFRRALKSGLALTS